MRWIIESDQSAIWIIAESNEILTLVLEFAFNCCFLSLRLFWIRFTGRYQSKADLRNSDREAIKIKGLERWKWSSYWLDSHNYKRLVSLLV